MVDDNVVNVQFPDWAVLSRDMKRPIDLTEDVPNICTGSLDSL